MPATSQPAFPAGIDQILEVDDDISGKEHNSASSGDDHTYSHQEHDLREEVN